MDGKSDNLLFGRNVFGNPALMVNAVVEPRVAKRL
jgi:hypothetical protein